jgi:hypothetical protein
LKGIYRRQMFCIEYLRIFISNWLRSGWVWGKMVNGLGSRCWMNNDFQYLNLNLETHSRLRFTVSKSASVSSVFDRNRVSTNVPHFATVERNSMKNVINFVMLQVRWVLG